FQPVIHESLLQLCNYRAPHFVMRIAPLPMCPAVAFPIIGDSHAADESESSVDDQNFSMRPKINARKMDESENLYCDTRALHQLDSASVYRVTSHSILHKMHFHATAGAFRECFGESIRNFAFLEKEILKRNATLR